MFMINNYELEYVYVPYFVCFYLFILLFWYLQRLM